MIYNFTNIFHQNIQTTISPVIAFFLILLGLYYGKKWIERLIHLGQINKALNIYFGLVIYYTTMSVSVVKMVKEYNEIDKIIALLVSFFWTVHSFNLIPGD